MNDQAAKKMHVESSDSYASILEALARIEEVPAGTTLIDQIPEAEWNDPEVEIWNIQVGSLSVQDADELDAADEHLPEVA